MNVAVDPKSVPRRTLYTGDTMPAIGMGTFGSDKYDPEVVSNAVAGAIRAGYQLFDCASVYGNEDRIGKVFKQAFEEGVVTREDLFITSKVWNDKHAPLDVLESCKKSLQDLQLESIDLYFVHWPFRNYHSPGCSGDARNPDSRPFSVEQFMETWRAMESLVEKGMVRFIGMSNMTIPKLEAVLPLCQIKPVAIELEMHPCFQQPELFAYIKEKGIEPIGFSPIGSPSRPERDKTDTDITDIELPEIVTIAKARQVHPAIVCIKWAVQNGQTTIPFSVKEEKYIANLKCVTEDPLTDAEMEMIRKADKNNRLIKGQVFLWEGAKGWEDLWDLDGTITK